MKAVIYTSYGGPEKLHFTEIDKPVPKDDEVQLKVNADSINDWDSGNIIGQPKLMSVFVGNPGPKIKILGSDIAGTIEAVGKTVTKFKVGDEVFGDLSGKWGGFAEYVCASEKKLEKKIPTMSFIDAAAIPQAGMLAVQGLIDAGKLRPGQKILINGAGGGVGTFGVQIAKTFENVEVTGVDNAGKLQMMRDLGFDHVIDYQKEDFTKNGKQYDLILDAKTNRPINHYARALTPQGIYATVGGDIGRLFLNLAIGPIYKLTGKKKFKLVMLKVNKDLGYMNELYQSGKLKCVIDGPYKLEEIVEAFKIFERGEHKGKIVLTL